MEAGTAGEVGAAWAGLVVAVGTGDWEETVAGPGVALEVGAAGVVAPGTPGFPLRSPAAARPTIWTAARLCPRPMSSRRWGASTRPRRRSI